MSILTANKQSENIFNAIQVEVRLRVKPESSLVIIRGAEDTGKQVSGHGRDNKDG